MTMLMFLFYLCIYLFFLTERESPFFLIRIHMFPCLVLESELCDAVIMLLEATSLRLSCYEPLLLLTDHSQMTTIPFSSL